MAWYIDTSAAAKLIIAEPESPALQAWIATTIEPVIACDLLRTELLRAVRRVDPTQLTRARQVLDAVILITASTATFERAAFLEPLGLRSLDAIHLAAALELGDELDGMIAYDDRLAGAASELGIAVVSPG